MSRHVGFKRLHNFRDLGGYQADDGRTVRTGLVYRSDSLSKLEGSDWDRFVGLGITTVIDLRYPWEAAQRGRVPALEGMTYVNLSVEHQPYDQAEIDPALEPWRYLADRYLEVAFDGAVELRQALDIIAGNSGPLVFHCASGKDRTGLLAAILLSLLSVSEDQIAADFALTELATQRLIADWQAVYPDRVLRWPGYGRAPAELINLVLSDLATRHGSVLGYARDILGVDDDLIATLRGRLLSPLS